MVFVERLDPPGGYIGEPAFERRECLIVERRTAGVGGVTQVLEQSARKLSMILRQFVDKIVKGLSVGQADNLDIFIIPRTYAPPLHSSQSA